MDVMRRCYDELHRPAGVPLATFEEAFTPCDEIVFLQQTGGTWTRHPVVMPRNHLKPGDAIDVAEQFWKVSIDLLRGFESHIVQAKLATKSASWLGRVVRSVERLLPSVLRRWARKLEADVADEVARMGFERIYRELEGKPTGGVGRPHHDRMTRALTILRLPWSLTSPPSTTISTPSLTCGSSPPGSTSSPPS